MITTSELRNELQLTARALSRKNVKVVFEEVEALLGEYGYCATLSENDFIVSLDLHLPIGTFYKVFLHEVAHTFTMGWKLPDREAAASEVASIWGLFNAQREPTDQAELIKWVRNLQSYHERNKLDYVFSIGANKGKFLPMTTIVCIGGQHERRV